MSQRGPRQYYYDSDPYWGSTVGGYPYPYSAYKASSYYPMRSYPYKQSYDYPDSYAQYPYSDYSYSDPYADRRYQGGYGDSYYSQYPPYDDHSSSGGYTGYMDEFGDERYPDYDMDMGFGMSTMPSGMAIAGLVIGLVSVLFCWMISINNLVFIAAVVGFFLSMYGTITTVMRKRSGKGIAISALILNSVAIAGVIITQSIQGTNLIEQFQELGENAFMIEGASFSAANNGSQPSKPSNAIGKSDPTLADDGYADGFVLAEAATGQDLADASSDELSARIESYSYAIDVNGDDAILVAVRWSNGFDGPKTANEMVSVAAYQNGALLSPSYISGADTFGSRNKEVEPGESSIFYAAFKLGDSSDATLKVVGLGSNSSSVVNETICKHL